MQVVSKTRLAVLLPSIMLLIVGAVLLRAGSRTTPLTGPLQSIALAGSVYVLQACGYPALREGALIRMNDAAVEVTAACGGQNILLSFGAVATAAALMIRRPVWERLLIVASSGPIAVLSNVLRVSVLTVLFTSGRSVSPRLLTHDVAGLLMMVLCLLLLALEIRLLSSLLRPPPPREVVPVAVRREATAV